MPDTAAVLILISLLGSPSFSLRQAATSQLEALGDVALPHLVIAARSPNLEAATRARRLVDASNAAWFARLLEQHPKLPIIDSLPLSHERRLSIIGRFCYLVNVDDGGGWDGCSEHGYDPELPYRVATRLFVVQQLLDGTPRAQIAWLLYRMVDREARCWDANATRWTDEP